MVLAHRIKELRNERKLTQQRLADLLGVDKSSISKYEHGVNAPDHEQLKKLSDVFNVSMDYLIGRTNNRNNSIIEGEYEGDHIEIEIEDKKINLTKKQIEDLINKLAKVGFDVNKLLNK